MCAQFTPDELEIFHAVKRAFDPDGLLNPGKVIPTIARCREYRLTHSVDSAVGMSADQTLVKV